MRRDLNQRPQLSRRAEKILLALLENPTQEKAAAAAGISKATMWRWLQKPEFQRALTEARREAYSQAVARLQQGSTAAATTLLRVMTDASAPTGSRVRAATCILDHAARAIGMQELELRLRDLETGSRANSQPSSDDWQEPELRKAA